MITVSHIDSTVAAYLARHPQDAGGLATLTAAIDAGSDLASRKEFTGHVTCSAVVVDRTGRVLHIRHNALNMWLRPGGHLESDDTTLIGAVLREITEETGIDAATLALRDEVPVDIDVHLIPANQAKAEPSHPHFDLRYAFTATITPAVRLQLEEVHDFAWLPGTEIEPTRLAQRVATLVPAP